MTRIGKRGIAGGLTAPLNLILILASATPAWGHGCPFQRTAKRPQYSLYQAHLKLFPRRIDETTREQIRGELRLRADQAFPTKPGHGANLLTTIAGGAFIEFLSHPERKDEFWPQELLTPLPLHPGPEEGRVIATIGGFWLTALYSVLRDSSPLKERVARVSQAFWSHYGRFFPGAADRIATMPTARLDIFAEAGLLVPAGQGSDEERRLSGWQFYTFGRYPVLWGFSALEPGDSPGSDDLIDAASAGTAQDDPKLLVEAIDFALERFLTRDASRREGLVAYAAMDLVATFMRARHYWLQYLTPEEVRPVVIGHSDLETITATHARRWLARVESDPKVSGPSGG